jgi:type VI secretion system protein ImpH
MFNNRIYALFYRAWKKYRLTSIAAAAAGDPLLRCVAALAGADPGAARAQRTLAYAGMLAGAPRSAAALETLLSDYFGGIPVAVQEFMPHHSPLPDPMRLGLSENAGLGTTAILGTSIFDRGAKFRVRIGPVLPEAFESFLPSGKNHADAKTLVEEFLAEPLDYDFEVLLQSEDLITVVLGADNARLGETAALGESGGVSEVKSMVLEGRGMAG